MDVPNWLLQQLIQLGDDDVDSDPDDPDERQDGEASQAELQRLAAADWSGPEAGVRGGVRAGVRRRAAAAGGAAAGADRRHRREFGRGAGRALVRLRAAPPRGAATLVLKPDRAARCVRRVRQADARGVRAARPPSGQGRRLARAALGEPAGAGPGRPLQAVPPLSPPAAGWRRLRARKGLRDAPPRLRAALVPYDCRQRVGAPRRVEVPVSLEKLREPFAFGIGVVRPDSNVNSALGWTPGVVCAPPRTGWGVCWEGRPEGSPGNERRSSPHSSWRSDRYRESDPTLPAGVRQGDGVSLIVDMTAGFIEVHVMRFVPEPGTIVPSSQGSTSTGPRKRRPRRSRSPSPSSTPATASACAPMSHSAVGSNVYV